VARTAAVAGRLVTLGPDEARRLLERELERPDYDGARATWWDRASRQLLEWLGSFRPGGGLDSPAFGQSVLWIAVVVLVAVAVVVVVARGLPRRRARTARSDDGSVFDDDDLRSARELGDAARSALRAGEWSAAVLDGYRAIARGLAERDLVPEVPGATARAVAGRAGPWFPEHADRIDRAARSFDDVRYLGAAADETTARSVLDTEASVRTTRPATESAVPT
jgi:hypothetical protein